VTGALAASMLGYVLPGVLYIRTHHKEAREVLNDLFGKDDCFEIIVDSNKSNNIDTDTYINNSNSGDNNDNSNIDNNRVDDNNNKDNNNNNNNSRGCIDNSNSDMHSNNMSSPSNDSEASPVNHMTGQNSMYNSGTKNLVTGRKRKTSYQKFVFMSRFFMPIFLIVFGCLAAIVGVTSVFYF
jgi:lipopolysaccharide export LptBFGC system permease protein LptF